MALTCFAGERILKHIFVFFGVDKVVREVNALRRVMQRTGPGCSRESVDNGSQRVLVWLHDSPCIPTDDTIDTLQLLSWKLFDHST